MKICADLTLELKGLYLQRKTLSWPVYMYCLETHGSEQSSVMDVQSALQTHHRCYRVGQSWPIRLPITLSLPRYGRWHHAFNIKPHIMARSSLIKIFKVSCLLFLIKKWHFLAWKWAFCLSSTALIDFCQVFGSWRGNDKVLCCILCVGRTAGVD